MFLSLSFSLPSPLSENNQIKSFLKKRVTREAKHHRLGVNLLDWLRTLAQAVPSAQLTTQLRAKSHLSVLGLHFATSERISFSTLLMKSHPFFFLSNCFFLHNTTICNYLFVCFLILYLSLLLDCKSNGSRNHVTLSHYSNFIEQHGIWPTTVTNKHLDFKAINFTSFGEERRLFHILSMGSNMLQWKEYNLGITQFEHHLHFLPT